MFSLKILDSKTDKERITTKEKMLGFFIGPVAVMLMNSILTNYLNVYYTDVLDLSGMWGGAFLSIFPVFAKILDVLTFVVMGRIVDKTRSRQGKARPWLLLSAPLLCLCMIMLFVVPTGNEALTAIWIFTSYTVFYAVAFTMYSTAHTLMVPLATDDAEERTKLSTFSNTPGMLAGSLIAVLFPMLVLPRIGVSRSGWLSVMLVVALAAFPVILLEYFYTRERVTEKEWQTAEYQKKHTGVEKTEKTPGLKAQLSCCLKSRTWIILMVYAVLSQVVNALFSASAIYYCNWILGSYNDGRTQSLFYALGQFPMGFGIFLAAPLARKFGKKNVITGGFILSLIGTVICLVAPTNLIVVMSGQIIRSFGSIPCSYLFAGLFGDALDDVEIKSGKRCDGFASSVFNSIITLSGGISLFIFNLGIGKLGYVSPALGADVVQPDAVKNFILFCVMGLQVIIYPVMAVLFAFMPKEKKEIANEEVKEVA